MKKNDKRLQNLKHFTPETGRTAGLKGQPAATIKRKQNKRFAEIIDKAFERIEEQDGEELTLKEKAVLNACKRAAKGDLDALALLAKLNGESKERVEVQNLPPVNMTAFGFKD